MIELPPFRTLVWALTAMWLALALRDADRTAQAAQANAAQFATGMAYCMDSLEPRANELAARISSYTEWSQP